MAPTGTTLVEVKQQIVTDLAARPGLADAVVTYDYPVESGSKPGNNIWMWSATADLTIPVMRSGTKKVQEQYELKVVAQVVKTAGEGQQSADSGAAVLLREIQQYFAETPQIHPDIMWAQVVGWAHTQGPFEDAGNASRGSRFEIRVSVQARLGL